MKKIFIILFALFFTSGSSFAIDRSRYESSEHKFRSQFTDSEWERHQLMHERFMRESYPELFQDGGSNPDDDQDHVRYRDYRHEGHNYNGYSTKYHKYNDDWRDNGDDRGHGYNNRYEYEYKHGDSRHHR